jgi:hypothetical protein
LRPLPVCLLILLIPAAAALQSVKGLQPISQFSARRHAEIERRVDVLHG